MAKGLEFKETKAGSNTHVAIDKDSKELWLQVSLDPEVKPVSSAGNEMLAKAFINFSHDGVQYFGNLNLNIGKKKAAIKKELADANAEIERLRALLPDTE